MDDRLPTLDAERVRLRWLTEADVPALFEIFSDREVARYWSSPALTDPAGAETLVNEIHDYFRQGTLFQWGVADRETDAILGTCTLASIDRQSRRAEIGFALGRRHWGRGYISEALTLLLRHAFGAMNLHRIEADVDPRNAASLKVLERLGFQREGHLRERWIVGGEISDSLMYGLLQRHWLRRQEGAGDRSSPRREP